MDNIKMYLQEVGWGRGIDWPGSRYGQVEGSCRCGNEPLGSIKCGKFHDWEPISFSRKALLPGMSKTYSSTLFTFDSAWGVEQLDIMPQPLYGRGRHPNTHWKGHTAGLNWGLPGRALRNLSLYRLTAPLHHNWYHLWQHWRHTHQTHQQICYVSLAQEYNTGPQHAHRPGCSCEGSVNSREITRSVDMYRSKGPVSCPVM